MSKKGLSKNQLYKIKMNLKEIKHHQVQVADGNDVKEIVNALNRLDVIIDQYLAFADENKG